MIDAFDPAPLDGSRRFHRWRSLTWTLLVVALPLASIGGATAAGYFSYVIANTKPNADTTKLAVSILKSGDASPEMRVWATEVLGIPTDRLPVTSLIASRP